MILRLRLVVASRLRLIISTWLGVVLSWLLGRILRGLDETNCCTNIRSPPPTYAVGSEIEQMARPSPCCATKAINVVKQSGQGRSLKEMGQDRFFVLEWKELQDRLVPFYRAYLEKHGGVRPRSPRSFHMALKIGDALPFENEWRKNSEPSS